MLNQIVVTSFYSFSGIQQCVMIVQNVPHMVMLGVLTLGISPVKYQPTLVPLAILIILQFLGTIEHHWI